MKKYPLLKHRRTRLHHLGEEQKKMGHLSNSVGFNKECSLFTILSFNLIRILPPLMSPKVRLFFQAVFFLFC